MSYLWTAILLAGLTALFMGVGYLIGGPNGALIAFRFAAAMNFFAYWNADRMVLSLHGAQEVDEHWRPNWFTWWPGSPIAPGCPCRVSVSWTTRSRRRVRDRAKSRACRGGRHDRPAASMLSRDELAGVLPTSRPRQELRHAPDDDHCHYCRCRLDAGAVRDVFGRRPSRQQWQQRSGCDRDAGDGRHWLFCSPRCSGRWRSAGRVNTPPTIWARKSAGIRTGLPRRWRKSTRPPIRSRIFRRNRYPVTAHLFIINPLSGARMDNLFSTHPATENRIAALEALAAETGSARAAPRPGSSRSQASPWGRRSPWG